MSHCVRLYRNVGNFLFLESFLVPEGALLTLWLSFELSLKSLVSPILYGFQTEFLYKIASVKNIAF